MSVVIVNANVTLKGIMSQNPIVKHLVYFPLKCLSSKPKDNRAIDLESLPYTLQRAAP
jgi:hypothetical protein